jgi:hypothetical protein
MIPNVMTSHSALTQGILQLLHKDTVKDRESSNKFNEWDWFGGSTKWDNTLDDTTRYEVGWGRKLAGTAVPHLGFLEHKDDAQQHTSYRNYKDGKEGHRFTGDKRQQLPDKPRGWGEHAQFVRDQFARDQFAQPLVFDSKRKSDQHQDDYRKGCGKGYGKQHHHDDHYGKGGNGGYNGKYYKGDAPTPDFFKGYGKQYKSDDQYYHGKGGKQYKSDEQYYHGKGHGSGGTSSGGTSWHHPVDRQPLVVASRVIDQSTDLDKFLESGAPVAKAKPPTRTRKAVAPKPTTTKIGNDPSSVPVALPKAQLVPNTPGGAAPMMQMVANTPGGAAAPMMQMVPNTPGGAVPNTPGPFGAAYSAWTGGADHVD